MKKFLRITLLAVFAVMLIQPANGQRILKKLREKVEERVEKKVEEKAEDKVDEAIDNQLDKLEEALEDSAYASRPASDEERRQRMQNIMKGFGMSGEPVPVADSYQFDQMIQMHVESFDANGNKESEGEFITHLSPNSKSMAYQMISGDMGEPGQGMFIIDADNSATIILSEEDGKKNGIVYGLGTFFQTMGESIEEDADLDETPESYLANPNVSKTGRTKNIAGYKCEEYKYSDETSESNIWITKDLKMNTRDFFSTLFKTSLYSHGIPWGYMMEVTTNDKETGEKSFMQVTKVDDNSNKNFSLAEYEITNLGSFNMPVDEGENTGEKE